MSNPTSSPEAARVPSSIHPSGVVVAHMGSISAVGRGVPALTAAVAEGRSGLVKTPVSHSELQDLPFNACIGVVGDALEAPPFAEETNDTRQLRMGWAALAELRDAVKQAVAHYGGKRVALVLGTSTGGISATEFALMHLREHGQLPGNYSCEHGHTMDAAPRQLANALGIEGPVYATSAACASGAKALISGKRLIESGLVDAVLAGGVDSIAKMTVHGFRSLQLLSEVACTPFEDEDYGMNVAEGGAWVLLENAERAVHPAKIALLGSGESSDAHHMSAPDPSGESQARAMRQALLEAAVEPGEVRYVNAHGTGTKANDSAERLAIESAIGIVPFSSTKALIGHQLGAAGASEAVIAACVAQGAAVSPVGGAHRELFSPAGFGECVTLSNSFAFGGANASLAFGPASRLTAAGLDTRSLPPALAASIVKSSSIVLDGSARTPDGSELSSKDLGGPILAPRARARAGELIRLFAESLSRLELTEEQLSQSPIIVGSALGQIQTTYALINLFLDGDASPLAFQNSVHNAAAGTLSIALKNRCPSSSIAAGADTFYAALLEALLTLHSGDYPGVILLVGDEVPPSQLGVASYPSGARALYLTRPQEELPTISIASERFALSPKATFAGPTPSALCSHGAVLAEALFAELREPASALCLGSAVSFPAFAVNFYPTAPAQLRLALTDLLPHRSSSLLLERVESSSPEEVICSTSAARSAAFCTSQSQPADGASLKLDSVVMTEWMAQAAAVFMGLQKVDGTTAGAKAGYLVGCRSVTFHNEHVEPTDVFYVSARLEWQKDGSASFEGRVVSAHNGEEVAQGQFLVHEPGVSDA